MIEHFNSQEFNKSYETRPLTFHEAKSPHFTCNFAFREKDTVMHITPIFQPTRPEFLGLLTNAVNDCLGIKKDQGTVEYIDDEFLEQPSFYVSLDGFGEGHKMGQVLVEKILTKLHESL